jgi:transcription antitermination factor NusG
LVSGNQAEDTPMMAAQQTGVGPLTDRGAMVSTQRFKSDQFQVGQRVRIQVGPFRGLEGVVMEDRAPRVVLSVRLVRTAAEMEVDLDWITPVAAVSTNRE